MFTVKGADIGDFDYGINTDLKFNENQIAF